MRVAIIISSIGALYTIFCFKIIEVAIKIIPKPSLTNRMIKDSRIVLSGLPQSKLHIPICKKRNVTIISLDGNGILMKNRGDKTKKHKTKSTVFVMFEKKHR